MKKRIAALLLALTLVFALALTASAAGESALDTEQTGTIDLYLRSRIDPDVKMTDGKIALYEVAAVTGYESAKGGLQIELTENFTDCGLSLDDLSADGLAERLAAWAEENAIAYTAEKEVDDVGRARFSDLPLGVYLVVQTEKAAGFRTMEPLLVIVPAWEDSAWNYAPAVYPKLDREEDFCGISGEKIWEDDDDRDGARPQSVTVRLWANGEAVDSVSVSAETNWSWSFTNLCCYDSEGNEIAYHVTEDAVPNYGVFYEDGTVINSYTPGKTSLTVIKNWDDENDEDGVRPSSVTVELLCNGEATGQIVKLSGENDWRASFTQLDMNTDGAENVYTVREIEIDTELYDQTISGDAATGYVVTNSRVETLPPPASGGEGDETVTETSVSTKTPATATTTTTTAASGKLPQTGMLIWPIPLLAIGGAALFVAGLILRRKKTSAP